MPNRTEDVDDPYEGEDQDDMFSQHRERPQQERWQRPRVVSEFVRRAIENTVGSMQNTGSLSREALQYLLQQGDRGKKEVVRIVAQEVGAFLRNVDLSSEVVKVLTSLQIEVSASVRFKPSKEGGVKPEITHNADVSPIPSDRPSSEPPIPERDSEPPKPSEGT
jgi:hypothetical protein